VMEAIATLEPLIAADNRTPYVHRLLGDLYLQVGLLNEAEARYQEAIALSTAPENTPDKAAAQVGMANVRAAQGKPLEAAPFLQQAKFNYALVGRGDRVEVIDQWFDRLELLR
jgi:predicted Zn-dependent protease